MKKKTKNILSNLKKKHAKIHKTQICWGGGLKKCLRNNLEINLKIVFVIMLYKNCF